MQYQIMHRNTCIALADDDRITQIIVPALCPACFAIGMPLAHWLDNRMVDMHRSHSFSASKKNSAKVHTIRA